MKLCQFRHGPQTHFERECPKLKASRDSATGATLLLTEVDGPYTLCD